MAWWSSSGGGAEEWSTRAWGQQGQQWGESGAWTAPQQWEAGGWTDVDAQYVNTVAVVGQQRDDVQQESQDVQEERERPKHSLAIEDTVWAAYDKL